MLAAALALLSLVGADLVLRPGETRTVVAAPSPTVIIPEGTFHMGATPDDLQAARRLCADELRGSGALLLELSPRCGSRFDAEGPQADVFLPAFAIDRAEVTEAAYAACVRAGGCATTPEMAVTSGGSLPVERVTWREAVAFCRWRGGRLPTEAEWEKAARGIGRRAWPWGGEWQERRANHGRSQRLGGQATEEESHEPGDGFATRAPAGSFPGGASAYGLLDMSGNVWEWTSGFFSREPPHTTAKFDPRGPLGGDERTIRGGSYRSPPSDLRVTRRVGLAPAERSPGVGFRCAYDVGRAPGRAEGSPVAAQLYVFMQHYEARGQSLEANLDEALATVKRAGFGAVQGWLDFFATPEKTARVKALLGKHGLALPAAYAGGKMHLAAEAEKTIATIVERAARGRELGLVTVVMNPDPLDREKTDEELATQAAQLDRLGARLGALGLRLAVHAHDKEMRAGAREWFHILRHTRPETVGICLDVHWALRGGQQPLRLLEAAGARIIDVHLRNSREGIWTEDLGPGEIDYAEVARALAGVGFRGTLTVELAWDPKTKRTRPLEENLARSRAFVRRVFGQ